MWGDEASQIRREVRKLALMGHVFPVLVFINKVLLEQSHQSADALSTVAMGLQWQTQVIQQRLHGLQSFKRFLLCPFTEKVCQPLAYNI